jgi:hypothetical protein
MTQEQIYDFIGTLAITLHTQNISISFTSLNAILADRNCAFDSNRGLAAAVAAAFRHWEAKPDLAVAHSIALTFKNKDGDFAWSAE